MEKFESRKAFKITSPNLNRKYYYILHAERLSDSIFLRVMQQ